MATYFDANTENGDGLQTLILMKQQSFNVIFHNSISSATSVNQPPSYLTSQAASSQGLSLSLSPRIQGMEAPLPVVDQVRIPVLRCKYMKAAQELLDEVIYLGKQAKNSSRHSDKLISAVGDGITKRGPQIELTTAEKQEIQMKKAKLVIMLHEVEQRYKQYEHKMQMVIRWLDEAAGEGSAKTYTALAFDTISKQFRCLKDAIFGQIRLANKNLGEEAKSEGWRLKYMDTQIRQHLGMVQHNAWRPQRGLPEDSVSILRAWLFDHFLHPYPKDDDKILLAKKTGLTRSQVSNWFINARVRLWKPMVEEMYAEEVKGQGQRTDDRIAGNSKHMEVPKETEIESKHIAMNFLATYPIEGQQQFQPSYSVNGVSLTLGLQHGENIMSKQTMHQGQGADIAQSNDIAPPTFVHSIGV